MMKPGQRAIHRCLVALTAGSLALSAASAWGKSVERTVGNGTIDWTRGTIRVTGSGAPPDKGSAAQKRLMAQRAAQADAYRQLAEAVNGVQVTAETVVQDFVTQSDVIRTRVSATIKGMKPVGKPRLLSDGAVEVDLSMPLFGSESLADALELGEVVEKQSNEPVPTTLLPGWRLASTDLFLPPTSDVRRPTFLLAQAGTPVTGLIVDAVELGVEPAMGPVLIGGPRRIYPGGQLKIDKRLVVAQGVVRYVDSLEAARQDRDRVGTNPLLVRAKAAVGRSHSDILIDDDSARQILEADRQNQFLPKLKVAIVV